MGTAKRERQKANKAQREQELARQAAKARTTRLALIIGGAIVGVFALVFIAGQFVGDDEPNDTVVPELPDEQVVEGGEEVDAGTPESQDGVEAPPVAEPESATEPESDAPDDSAIDAES